MTLGRETSAEIVEGTETTHGAEIEAETEDSNRTDHNQEEETTGSHRLVKSVNKKDTPMTNVRWSRRQPKWKEGLEEIQEEALTLEADEETEEATAEIRPLEEVLDNETHTTEWKNS